MTKQKQQQDIIIGSISISLMAQWKMSVHATTRPLGGGGGTIGQTIHGIVLGHRSKSTASAAGDNSKTSSSLVVTNVVPVCRETPTKPIVDMALRLVDAHLMQKEQQTKIIGWYTSSSTAGNDANEEEDTSLPNASACRILSSIAESACDDGAENEDGPFVLLSLSNSSIVDSFIMDQTKNNKNNSKSPMVVCKAYQWETKSRTLVRRTNVVVVMDEETKGQQNRQKLLPTEVYDFVDHMNDCDFVDSKWIEN